MAETQAATEASAAQYWEERYSGTDQVWSGKVNQVLVDSVAGLVPGRALDLGCGEGGDALWLAWQGWTVTGVDLSPTAVARGRRAAAAAGIPEDRLRFEVADLAGWTPTHGFELVSCAFLHSWSAEIPREEILRRATGFVDPGGHLLVSAHAAPPPWTDPESITGHAFPTPESDLRMLALDPDRWEVLIRETREREATSPDGGPATLIDGILLARRIH